MTEESRMEEAQMIGETTQRSVIRGRPQAPLIIDYNQALSNSSRRWFPGYLGNLNLASVLKYQVIL